MLRSIFQIVALSLFSCVAKKDITGLYRSNFAVPGTFEAILYLNNDSTFNYRSSGDILFDTSIGHFQTSEMYLLLIHGKISFDTIEISKNIEGYTGISGIQYNRRANDTSRYVLEGNKLYLTDSNGYMISERTGSFRRKQYLLFGSHFYNRKYYLKKVK